MTSKERVGLLKNSKPEYVLYWHHLFNHNDPFKQGYIGVAFVSKYGKRFSGILQQNYQHCTHFENAIKKYGEENIITTILLEGLSKENADNLEFLYRHKPSIGWNIRQGGGNKGKLAQSSKDKISKNRKGKNSLLYNKIFTEKSREKIRKSKIGNINMLGKKHKKETLIKMSESAIKRGIHPNTIIAKFKKVICVETNIIYESQIKAEEMTGISHKYISACCTGRQKTAGKLHWKFYKENEK
jgi:group I intron endonuclease